MNDATMDSNVSFKTCDNSPWPDGYDLDAERAAVAELNAMDEPDPLEPLYPRLQLLWQREEDLLAMQARDQRRHNADEIVPDALA